MSRLPVIGGDDGTWGAVLNDFLSQSVNSNGTLNANAVDAVATAIQSIGVIVTTGGVLSANQSNLVNASAGSVVMTLPTGATLGTLLGCVKTDSSTNVVTISGSIRGVGSSSLTLKLTFEGLLFCADSSGSWWPIADHKTLGSLDARYDAAGLAATETTRATIAEGTLTTSVSTNASAIATETTRATTVEGTKANNLVPVSVVNFAASPFSAAANTWIPVDTSAGNVVVNLPTTPANVNGAAVRVGIKMVIQGGANTITIHSGGSDVFNKSGGGTSLTLTLLSQGMMLQYNVSTGIWYVQADDLSLSSLDARYVPVGALAGLPFVTFTNTGTTLTSTAYGTDSVFYLTTGGQTCIFPTGVGASPGANAAVIAITNSNSSTSSLTLTLTGNTNGLSTVVVTPGQSATFFSDNLNWMYYTQSVSGTNNGPSDATQVFSYPGAITTGIQAPRLMFTSNHTILGISASINIAPVGASLVVDILKNGTTVYGTHTGNKPTILTTANISQNESSPVVTTNGETVPDTVSVVAGDYLQIDVTQIGSTTAGSDLTVNVRYL